MVLLPVMFWPRTQFVNTVLPLPPAPQRAALNTTEEGPTGKLGSDYTAALCTMLSSTCWWQQMDTQYAQFSRQEAEQWP